MLGPNIIFLKSFLKLPYKIEGRARPTLNLLGLGFGLADLLSFRTGQAWPEIFVQPRLRSGQTKWPKLTPLKPA